MAIKTLRVFQEFTSEGYVPMPPSGNIDYGYTIAGTFPEETPTTFQLDDPDLEVEVTEMTDFYVWIRSHGSEWNINYTRNVRVYPDSPLINNVVMGIIIANLDYTVPYVGATENVDLGEFGISGGFLHLDNTPTTANVPTTPGTLSWNDSDGTADLKLKGGNVTLQLGQEQVVRVVNKTGATLNEADFRAVRVRSVAEGGAQGQRLAVKLAQADSDADSATTIGLVTENILNNQEGFITTSGNISKVDTTGAKSYGGTETWVDGDVLYLSPTHPGYLTKVKPQAPDHTVIIGWVVYAHAVNGKIFVKVDNGYELDELHNVKINNPLLDDFLMYDTTLNVWKNKDLHGTKGYIPYYNDTTLFLNSPFWTNGSLVGLGTITPSALLHMKGTTAYTNVILDNNGSTGGGMFSAYQNGSEVAMFGTDAYYQTNTSIDAAIAAKKVGGGIQFYTNGSQSEKMGINSDGNVFVGQTPTYVAGATQLIVRGKTGAGYLGVNHYDMSIKGFMNTFNSVFQIGTSTFHSLAFLVEDSERGRVNSSGRLLWGTTTDNGVDLVQINGSLVATSIKKQGGLSTEFLMADGSVSSGSTLTASLPLSITGGVISISQATNTSNGYLSSTDWTTFNAKQSALSGSGFVKVSGTTVSYDNTAYTPTSRLLTINGTSYDLSADRSWTITPGSGMRNIQTFTATSGQTTFTITGGYTVGLVDVFVNGTRLSTSDFTATNGTSVVLGVGVVANDIVDIVIFTASLTSGITGSGTTNFLPLWSGSSSLTNSLISQSGTTITANGVFKANGAIASMGGGLYAGSGYQLVFADFGGSEFASIEGSSFSGAYSYLRFITNANERMRITSAGLVGINTSSPRASLDVVGNIYSRDIWIQDNYSLLFGNLTTGASSTYIYGVGGDGVTNYLGFATNGSEKVRILANGNVGIGTATPSEKLSVIGNIRIDNGAADGGQLVLASSGFSDWNIDNFSGSLRAYYGGTEYIRLTSSGNLGIGTTSPTSGYKLDVVGSILSRVASGNVSVVVQTNDANGAMNAITGFGLELATDSTNQGIRFRTGATEKMRILSGGNVGIGTTSPSQKLDVNGAMKSLGNFFAVNNTPFSTNGTITYHDTVGLVLRGVAGFAFDFSVYNPAGNVLIANPTGTNNISFPSGNVGIGTSSPTYKLQVEGNTFLHGDITFGLYGETTYFRSAQVLNYLVIGGTENITFQTYDNAWLNRMTLTKVGNLGIGTIAPTRRLDVASDGSNWISGTFSGTGGTDKVVIGNLAMPTIGGHNSALNAWSNFTIAGVNIMFSPYGSEAMRITDGALVGIGTTAPATKLHINTSGDTVIRLTSTAGAYSSGIQMFAAGAGAGFIYSNQSVYVTANANGVYLPTNGTSWVANSDLNLKNIESYIENAIESIMDLKAIRFNWKADAEKSTNIGLIAQEVEKVYPELINKNREGYLGVRYTELIPILVKAIQELNAKLEAK